MRRPRMLISALAVLIVIAGAEGVSAHPSPRLLLTGRPAFASPYPAATETAELIAKQVPARSRRIPAPPFALTMSTMVFVDHSRPTVAHGVLVSSSRTLTTLIWAPTAPGRWPLLVFAHGFEVGPGPYEPLLRAWAARGYVVVAPEFPLTDQAVAGANLDENDIQQQPADVRFLIDELVAHRSPLARRIDANRVGVAGHSDGAETALEIGVEPTPGGEPRIRSVIAMSVAPLQNFPFAANPPILVTQGDVDTINLPEEAIQTWRGATSPKYLLILHGAGHLPPLEPGSSWLPAVEATTEAFLSTYLAGTTKPHSIIAAGSVPPLMSITRG